MTEGPGEKEDEDLGFFGWVGGCVSSEKICNNFTYFVSVSPDIKLFIINQKHFKHCCVLIPFTAILHPYHWYKGKNNKH